MNRFRGIKSAAAILGMIALLTVPIMVLPAAASSYPPKTLCSVVTGQDVKDTFGLNMTKIVAQDIGKGWLECAYLNSDELVVDVQYTYYSGSRASFRKFAHNAYPPETSFDAVKGVGEAAFSLYSTQFKTWLFMFLKSPFDATIKSHPTTPVSDLIAFARTFVSRVP